MTKKIVALGALVALAGLAAASALTVQQRNDTASLFAERYTVGELFLVEESTLAPVVASLPAAGIAGSPVEMTSADPLPEARTALAQDHWAYAVVVKEATAGAVGAAQFAIELQLDGVPVSTLYASQGVVESSAVEGVRARFDLGATVQSSSLYYVVVKPFVPTGPTIEMVVRSNPNGNNTWLGVGGGSEGVVNPAIDLELGSTLRMSARNADEGVHNVGFRTSAGTLIDPPGWSPIVDGLGEEEVISWTPAAAGTYEYRCQFHASMTGIVTVA